MRRSLEFVRPDRGTVVLAVLLSLLVATLNVLEPLVLKRIFDALAAGEPLRALAFGVGLFLGLAVLREAFGTVGNWLTWRARLRVQFRLQEAVVGRLQTLPLSFHRKHGVGAVLTRMDRGISGFVGAASELLFGVLPAAFFLAFAIVIMFQLDWRLAVVALAFTPLPVVIGALASPEQVRRERDLTDRWAAIYARFNEVLTGIVTVKSFAREDEEKNRFLRDVRGANEVVSRGVLRDSRSGALRSLVTVLARITVIGLGGYLVLTGRATLGTLVAFIGYVGALFGPVQGLTGTYQTVRRGQVALDTIYGVLDAQDRLGDEPDAIGLVQVAGRVDFEHVGFAYEGSRTLLQDIDLHVEPGEVVALVGPSGSGKTTLMALLQRLYDPTFGCVRIDGIDVRKVKQRSLRRQIGVVLQEPLLFNDTVRNAIAYGRPGVTDAEVEAAARAANAHDFILRLPDGYATRVGERGSRLSAGERQRITIARALLKDPPILILDEATSALDAETEAQVQEALERLMRGRTVFVIAHRLATVVGADRIVVLRGGRIAEQGPHAQLLAQGGYYALLVRHQTKGLLPIDPPTGGPQTMRPPVRRASGAGGTGARPGAGGAAGVAGA